MAARTIVTVASSGRPPIKTTRFDARTDGFTDSGASSSDSFSVIPLTEIFQSQLLLWLSCRKATAYDKVQDYLLHRYVGL